MSTAPPEIHVSKPRPAGHSGLSTIRRGRAGLLELEAWGFSTGARETRARLHIVGDVNADATANATSDFVYVEAWTVDPRTGIRSQVELFLGPAQAAVLALQLARAATEAAQNVSEAEAAEVRA